jgi:hypothetical protein
LTTSEITPESIGKNEYQWVLRHKRKYDKNELSEYEACKIEELKLERFFESWDAKFELVEKWLLEHRRFPTKTTNKTLYQWLMSQRLSYKNGNLDLSKSAKLREITFDLDATGNEKMKEKWLDQLNNYKTFLETNTREPSANNDEYEKSLYIWAQAQRAVYAGSAKNRKALPQDKIDALNSIKFTWIGKGNKKLE